MGYVYSIAGGRFGADMEGYPIYYEQQNGIELEQVVHTHRLSCLNDWPRRVW